MGLGLLLWMVAWWSFGGLPLALPALLPLLVLPASGALPEGEVAGAYGQPVVFLLLGALLLGLGLERSGLPRRLALLLLGGLGGRPRGLLLALMGLTGLLSMWISNTAAAALMLAAAKPLLAQAGPRFRTGLVLGVAFASSIGGMATLVGTPPNALLAGYLRENLDRPLEMASWMALALPASLALLLLAWGWLLWLFPPPKETGLRGPPRTPGPWRPQEVWAAAILGLALLGFLLRGPLGLPLSDAGVALLAASLLFLPLPGAKPLPWPEARRIPWEVLLLVGGGLALGRALEAGELPELLLRWLPQGGLAAYGVLALLVLLSGGLSAFLSNTATAAALIPLVAAAAPGLGLDPLPALAAVALGSSLAFLLPISTPANALASAQGVGTWEMVRAGLPLQLLGALLLPLFLLGLEG